MDTQGYLALVTVIIYQPILLLSFRLARKYGFTRDSGWMVILIFSLIRIAGGGLLAAAEQIHPTIPGLYIGGHALENCGLSPLLLCTLGFLSCISQGSFDRMRRRFWPLRILCMFALILTIVGISLATGSKSSSQSLGNIMGRVAIILFASLFVIILGVIMRFWSRAGEIMTYRKSFLGYITIAMPFLTVRVLYSVLSTFSSDSFISGSGVETSKLAKFNMFTGTWWIYLVMFIIMEYACVVIFVAGGLRLPLDQDYKLGKQGDEVPMSSQHRHNA